MTNGQNAARGRHLDDLAAAFKRFTLQEILAVTNAVAAELENISISGGGSSSSEIVLPTVANSVNGGFWLDVSGETPVPKFFYGGKVYTLGGNAESTLPAGLVSWLKFNTDATTDECGLAWEATGNPTVSSTNAFSGKALQLDGSSYLTSEQILLGGKDFTVHFRTYGAFNTDQEIVNFFPNGQYVAYTFAVTAGRSSGYTTGYKNASNNYVSKNDTTVSVRNKQTHCAIVYQHEAGKLDFYADGTNINSYTVTIPRLTYVVYLGCDPTNSYNRIVGTIDEFQIFDGVALWDSDFTPPTIAFYR